MRRDRLQLSAEAVETIERLALLGDAHARKVLERSNLSIVDRPPCEVGPWVSVRKAAEILGTSEQAVTERCRRGTLASRQPGGAGHPWQVSMAAVEGER